MAKHSDRAKGAMDMLAELEQDESKDKVEEFLLSLDGLGFFTSKDSELFEVQKIIHEKIKKLLGDINLLADPKLADLLENFHKTLGGTIEKNRKSLHSALTPPPLPKKTQAPAGAPPATPPPFKMAGADKKEFLLSMALGEMKQILEPVYEIKEKDPKKVSAELRAFLEQIQPVCKNFIDNEIVIDNPDMSMDEMESKAVEIKKSYAKIEPRIKRYLKIEKETMDAEMEKAHGEGLKDDKEWSKTKKAAEERKAKAEAEKKTKAEIETAHGEALEEDMERAHGEALIENNRQSLNTDKLFKEVLIKPDDYKPDSKSPEIQAIMALTKNFDKSKLAELATALRTSGKIPTASQTKKIDEMMAKGITTSDELDKKIVSLEEDIDKEEGAIDNLNSQIAQQTTIIQSMRGNVDQKDKDNLKSLNEKLTAEKTKLRESKNQLKACKEIQPFIGGSKMSPRQLLLRVVEFNEIKNNKGKEASLLSIGEMADKLVAAEEKKLAPHREWLGSWKQWDKYSQLIKPSLKATLAEFTKIEALEGVRAEELEELVKLRKDPEGLAVWIEKRKEKAKAVVPAIMAYLQMAIVDGKLNILSRGQAMELLKNLRSVRNKRILSQINGKPELLNAKPQVRMQAYLTEMNEWDEKSVLVNREIVDDLIRKSYVSNGLKAGVALSIGIVAHGPILIAMSHIGLGALAKIGAVGATIKGRKMFKDYKPEYETAYRHIVPRAVGCWILGPIGLAAPELMSGVKFVFNKHKEKAEKDLKEGKGETSLKWAIASGLGRGLAWPFKKLFGKKTTSIMKKAA